MLSVDRYYHIYSKLELFEPMGFVENQIMLPKSIEISIKKELPKVISKKVPTFPYCEYYFLIF